jgi:hypothetical protein
MIALGWSINAKERIETRTWQEKRRNKSILEKDCNITTNKRIFSVLHQTIYCVSFSVARKFVEKEATASGYESGFNATDTDKTCLGLY